MDQSHQGRGNQESAALIASTASRAKVKSSDPRTPRALFSELMYHPVGEDNPQELHEFIEIHNPSAVPMDLGGARIEVDLPRAQPLLGAAQAG